MTYNEFVTRLPKDVKKPTNEEYDKIEYVYAWHPSISETGCEGKDQIAALYSTYGMRIILDMLPTAKKCEGLREELRAVSMRADRIKEDLKALKAGDVE